MKIIKLIKMSLLAMLCFLFISAISSADVFAATECEVTFIEHKGNSWTREYKCGEPFAYLGPAYGTMCEPDCGFAGLYDEDNPDVMITQRSIVPNQEKLTLRELWIPNCNTVVFNTGLTINGWGQMIVMAVPWEGENHYSGVWFDELPTVDKPNDYFVGWYTKNDNGGFARNVYAKTVVHETQNYEFSNHIAIFAEWASENHKIIYDKNGATSGTMTNSIPDAAGNVIIKKCEYKREGYVFTGWNTRPDGSGITYLENSPAVINRSLVLYAQWKAPSYLIKYDINGGSKEEEDALNREIKEVVIGEQFGNLPNPIRSGYVFGGWKTSTGVKVTSSSTVKKDYSNAEKQIVLKAQWTPVSYTIKYNKNGGSGTLPSNKSCKYDTSYTLSKTKFTKTGYTHTGWYWENDDGSTSRADLGGTVLNLTKTNGKTVVLKAEWTPKTYYISYSANGGTGSMQSSQVLYSESIYLRKNEFIRDEYTFKCWNTKKDGSGTSYLDGSYMGNVTKDKELYAQWTANEYPIYFDINGGEAANEELINSTARMQKIGKKYSNLPEPSTLIKTGYYCDAWYTKSGVKVTSTTVASSADISLVNGRKVIVLFAHWNQNKYIIKYNKNGSSDTTTIPQTTAYFDTPIALTSNKYSRSGYKQKGWTDASGTIHYGFGETVMNLTTVKNGTVTLYADWEAITYTMKFNLNGGDILVDENGKEISNTEYIFGSTYWGEYLKSHSVLPTPQRYGYTFTGWYTSKDGTTKITETKKADQKGITAYAHWKVNTYSIGVESTLDKMLASSVGTFGEINVASPIMVVTKSWKYDKSSAKRLPAYPDDNEYAILVSFNTKEDGTGSAIPICSKYTDVVKIVENEAGGPVKDIVIYEVWEGKGCFATLMDDGADVGGTYWGTYGEYWENKFPTLKSSEKTFVGWYDVPDDNLYNNDFSDENGTRINNINSEDPTKYTTKVDRVGNINYYAHWMSNTHKHESRFYSDGSGDLIVLWDCEIEGCKIKHEELNPYQYYKLREEEEKRKDSRADYKYIDAIVEFFDITGCAEEQIATICAVYDYNHPFDDYSIISKSQVNTVVQSTIKIDMLLNGDSKVLTAELKATEAYAKYNKIKYVIDMASLIDDLYDEGSEWGDVNKNDKSEKVGAWLKICGKGLTKIPGFGPVFGSSCNAVFNELAGAIVALIDREELYAISFTCNGYLSGTDPYLVTYKDYNPATNKVEKYTKSIFELTVEEWGDAQIYECIADYDKDPDLKDNYKYSDLADKYKCLRTFYEVAHYDSDDISAEGFAQYCMDYCNDVLH